MINFLRSNRARLFFSSKISKYLLYAIGEIILVVIGILIALQVNNWNEREKELKLEHNILLNLKTELQDNLNALQLSITKRNQQLGATNLLLNSIRNSSGKNDTVKLDSLIGLSRYLPNFEARSGVIEEIINSGKLNLLENEELRKILSNWSGDLEDLRRKEDGLQDIILLQYNPYLAKNYTLRNSDDFIVQELWKNNPNLNKNWRPSDYSIDSNVTPEKVRSDPEFESLISLINLWAISSQITSEEIKTKMNHTLEIIENELKTDE
ncbi:DUF6090 family protein [Aegicerativicinus sediminis]|uniref:DUF6090 family protein n=1 Tax=Aegicerativicinus sediminis TaxID=2893202 RepID=UPI001E3C0C21|nr:DUF6090 family protein [Aegicerativicinus sediminis]